MTLDDSFLQYFGTFLMTYLLHSSLMIGGVFVVTRLWRIQNLAIAEFIWKFAMVVPLFSAMAQNDMAPRWKLNLSSTPQSVQILSDESFPVVNPEETSLLNSLEIPPQLDEFDSESQHESETLMPETLDDVPSIFVQVSEKQPDEIAVKGKPDTANKPTRVTKPPSIHMPTTETLLRFVGCITIGGVVLLIVQFVYVCLSVSKFETLTTGVARRTLDQLLAENRLPFTIRLVESRDIIEPAAFGVFHRSIAIPKGLAG